MNVARGFVRLWLVLTALWVFGIAWLAKDDVFAVADGVDIWRGGDDVPALKYIKLPNGKETDFPDVTAVVIPKSFLLIDGKFATDDQLKEEANRFWDNCLKGDNPKGAWTENPYVILAVGADLKDYPEKCSSFMWFGDVYVAANHPDWPRRFGAVRWILIPPVLMLLLGFVVAWVVKGFRR